MFGAIQVLCKAVGGGWVSAFLGKSITEVYRSTLLVLQGGGWKSNSQEKSIVNVTLEWPLTVRFIGLCNCNLQLHIKRTFDTPSPGNADNAEQYTFTNLICVCSVGQSC